MVDQLTKITGVSRWTKLAIHITDNNAGSALRGKNSTSTCIEGKWEGNQFDIPRPCLLTPG